MQRMTQIQIVKIKRLGSIYMKQPKIGKAASFFAGGRVIADSYTANFPIILQGLISCDDVIVSKVFV